VAKTQGSNCDSGGGNSGSGYGGGGNSGSGYGGGGNSGSGQGDKPGQCGW